MLIIIHYISDIILFDFDSNCTCSYLLRALNLHHTSKDCIYVLYRVSQKKRNTFDLKYLKDGSIKLIVLLVCYSVLPYNSIEPNFSFLWLSEAKILSFKLWVWFWRFSIYISKLGSFSFHYQIICPFIMLFSIAIQFYRAQF